jgi:hypothetical protein
MRENEMSDRKCPVCGEIMIHTDLTDMDRCNNPTCGDMHVLIPPNYQTYADRLAARVAELERENKAMKILDDNWLKLCNELKAELAAAKAENEPCSIRKDPTMASDSENN